jgi:hypothetical protein
MKRVQYGNSYVNVVFDCTLLECVVSAQVETASSLVTSYSDSCNFTLVQRSADSKGTAARSVKLVTQFI